MPAGSFWSRHHVKWSWSQPSRAKALLRTGSASKAASLRCPSFPSHSMAILRRGYARSMRYRWPAIVTHTSHSGAGNPAATSRSSTSPANTVPGGVFPRRRSTRPRHVASPWRPCRVSRSRQSRHSLAVASRRRRTSSRARRGMSGLLLTAHRSRIVSGMGVTGIPSRMAQRSCRRRCTRTCSSLGRRPPGTLTSTTPGGLEPVEPPHRRRAVRDDSLRPGGQTYGHQAAPPRKVAPR